MNNAKNLLDMLNEMANLRPSDTGLSVFIWVDEMGGYRNTEHNIPRLKIAVDNPSNQVAVVSISETPELLEGGLKLGFNKIKKWIILNYPELLEHWNGDISTAVLFKNIKRVKSTTAKQV